VSLYKANVFFNSNGTPSIKVDIGNSGTSDAVIKAIYFGNSSPTMANAIFTSATTATITTNEAPVNFTVTGITRTNGTSVYFKILPSAESPLTFNEKP
jgi:hypothetical protein